MESPTRNVSGPTIFLTWCVLCLSGQAIGEIPSAEASAFRKSVALLHREIGPAEAPSAEILAHALTGYYNLVRSHSLPVENRITVIDYSRPSTEERLWVIDLSIRRILFRSLVAHGKHTGQNRATSFSNEPGSRQSSLGCFVTADTYMGKHGYSLRLRGMEPGINDRAEQRDIVIHGADYVSRAFIARYGRLGRSWGCPALPPPITKAVIDAIKSGSFLFVYSDDPAYLNTSTCLDRTTAAQWYVTRIVPALGRD